MYQSIDQVGDKKSTYTFYVNADNKHPVHYEMFGYDTLIGSHFDKYTIDYYNYDEEPIDPSVFHVTAGTTLRLIFSRRPCFHSYRHVLHWISWPWP